MTPRYHRKLQMEWGAGWKAWSVRGMGALNRLESTDTWDALSSTPTSTLISQTNNKYLTVRMRVGVSRMRDCVVHAACSSRRHSNASVLPVLSPRIV